MVSAKFFFSAAAVKLPNDHSFTEKSIINYFILFQNIYFIINLFISTKKGAISIFQKLFEVVFNVQ